jgi:hypothetical protein
LPATRNRRLFAIRLHSVHATKTLAAMPIQIHAANSTIFDDFVLGFLISKIYKIVAEIIAEIKE